MENIQNIIVKLYNNITDTVLPISCVGCNKRGNIICENCIYSIRQAERETESNIYACFDYRDEIIKKIIWNLKYYHHFSLGRRLGRILYENMIEEIADLEIYTKGSPILVIPVPISKSKNKTRGYNQAEIIARNFCNSSNKKIFEFRKDIVIKIKDTLSQARTTNRNDRLQNVKGVFGININKKKILKGRTVIIIDDVTTTGGTITEIMKVLKRNGVKKVVGMTVAH